MKKYNFQGVKITKASFVPKSIKGKSLKPKYMNEKCNAIEIKILDRDILDPIKLSIRLLDIIYKIHPYQFKFLDGNFIDWRDANVHVLTHAMHYASSVFEGERAYNGKIFKSLEHSERFKKSANLIDFEIPYSVEEIEKAKYQALEENGLTDAYVRAFAWRGAGEDMGVASSRNPVRVAVAVWSWGNYYGDAKFKGAKLDLSLIHI